ncbi:MAG: hypothetical protein JW885_05745 [Deltaproteobacteria bacterium]|nr:hypothetical protein [Candidatus Zymogenaceae bacterium]
MGMNRKEFRNPTFDERTRTYINSPTYRGFPLGGIGTGGVSLFADGDFSECRTAYNWFRAVRDLRGSFFALRTEDARGTITSRLLRKTHHHSREFSVPNIAETRFRGRVPHFELDFVDESLPVTAKLSGFTPLIPHNEKDSSVPAALFDLVVTNPTDHALTVSALFSWQSPLGITGTAGSPLTWKHTFKTDVSRYCKNRLPAGDIAGVSFGIDTDFDPKDTRRRAVGEQLIATEIRDDRTVSTCPTWDEKKSVPSFWEEFTGAGRISPAFGTGGKSGAVCVEVIVSPGESETVPFYLIWHSPHYVLQKEARKKLRKKVFDGIDYGTFAQNSFDGTGEVLSYLIREKERLFAETMELPGILTDPEVTDLPEWLIDVVLNATDSMLTNTVLTKTGDYSMIEGMDWQFIKRFQNSFWPFGGLTGTNDQRLSSHPYSSVFFPGLDKSELETFRDLAHADGGKVPHGNGGAEIALGDADTPYSKPIPWINDGKNDWPDLTCSLILQMGKLIKITGDLDLLYASWRPFLEMTEYLLTLVENNVPEGSSTYDVFSFEPCFLYHATLYAAANRMLADLSRHIPDDLDPDIVNHRAAFIERAKACEETLTERLWMADKGYFRAAADNEHLFQGGLAGDWICRYAGLHPVIEPNRARSHSLIQHDILVKAAKERGKNRTSFGGAPLPYNEAGLDKKEVPIWLFGVIRFWGYNYIYQALSYQAFEAIYLGNTAEGLELIKMVYDKVYREGYPWDMNLMGLPGFVYMTHPVMWALFNALTGAAMDVLTGTLTLSPKALPGKTSLTLPVFFPRFWLAVSWDEVKQSGTVRVLKTFPADDLTKQRPVSLRDGAFVLNELILTGRDDRTRTIDLGGFMIEEGAGFDFSL